MAEPILTSSYKFETTTAGFTANNELYTKILFVKKTIPLSDISSIVLKESSINDKLQLRIKINKNGKERLILVVQFDRTSDEGKLFLEELKKKVPSQFVWENKIEEEEPVSLSTSGKHTYPLQFWWFRTKSLAGNSRGVQIFVNYGTFCVLVFPIPLLIYVIAAGCHQITTTNEGITIKKLFGSFYSWDDISSIEVTRYNINITSYGIKTREAFLLSCELISKQGKNKKFIIRTKEGKSFVKEMVARKKMSPEIEKIFI